MTISSEPQSTTPRSPAGADRNAAILPRRFSSAKLLTQDAYLSEPATLKLLQFFEAKGITAIKQEERNERWYEDWLTYQAEHRIYASVLSPREFSTRGVEFDPLRYARFLEVFACCSPGHGYSLQVSFLGLFAFLMGDNAALKREAVATLEQGGLLAFAVSEKTHGSDLLGYEFKIALAGAGRFVANGSKYYIGNANAAAMIAILAKKEGARADGPAAAATAAKRAPFAMFALRPKQSPGFGNVRKIHTLGVRAGFVGEFDVQNHEFPESDLLAEGRQAWDAVLGTVTLGKFFLGFGSIGICEHAMAEARDHLGARILYGNPVLEMPHIRAAMAQAYARLTAMKLYAYRALDYLAAARADDRRYLLFCAVQKAKVSTEGVKTMATLSECVGAKGFESDTYFEMAMRDIQLIPSLESSAHINLGLTAQFIPRYFARFDAKINPPPSLLAGQALAKENPYLTRARTGGIGGIAFPPVLRAYGPLNSIPNVRLFVRQVKHFRLFLLAHRARRKEAALDLQYALALGQCLATIAYGQLIAEHAQLLDVPAKMLSAIFHLLVADLGAAAQSLAALGQTDAAGRFILRRMIKVPRARQADWDFVAGRMDLG